MWQGSMGVAAPATVDSIPLGPSRRAADGLPALSCGSVGGLHSTGPQLQGFRWGFSFPCTSDLDLHPGWGSHGVGEGLRGSRTLGSWWRKDAVITG